LDFELRGSRDMLGDKLGIPITIMSLQGGRSDRRVLKACRNAVYTNVYTFVPRVETKPLEFTVGRINISSH
jgi:hypothetical protein